MQGVGDIQNERILYSFLNWGKGHLSRSIELIKQLSEQHNELFICCSEADFDCLKSYVSNLNWITFEGYPLQFSGEGNFGKDLLLSRKALLRFVAHEFKKVEELVAEHQISLVISDHRYGFRSEKVPSIFITHQVQLALKWWQFPAQLLHKNWLKLFNHIWIMDTSDSALAGKLSHQGKFKNASYIGHFSRFEPNNNHEKTIVLGVCNGPHPYDQMLLEQLEKNEAINVIISSIPTINPKVVNPQNWKESDHYFYQAKKIIAYMGYSTLMDVQRLGCDYELKPTPGQLEQIYLYHLHQSKE